MAEPLPFLFFMLFFGLSLVDRIVYNSWATPFIILSTPFLVILLGLNFFGDAFGYFHVSNQTYVLLVVAFVAFWLGQALALVLVAGTCRQYTLQSNYSFPVRGVETLFYLIAIIGLAASLVSYGKIFLTYGYAALSDDTIAELTGSGVLAHLRFLTYPAAVFFFIAFFEQRKVHYFIIFFLCLLSLFIYGVKYHSMFVIMTIFFYLTVYRKVNFFITASLIFSTFALFLLNYFIAIFIRTGTLSLERIKWTLFHMSDYVVGGLLVLSRRLENIYLNVDTASIENMFLVTIPKVFSSSLNSSSLVFCRDFTEIRPGHSTNVATLFFDIYINSGMAGIMIWMFFAGLFFTFLVILSLNHSSLGIRMLVSHILTILTLSFFSNYFLLLSTWEYSLLMIVTAFLAGFKLTFQGKGDETGLEAFCLERKQKPLHIFLILKNSLSTDR